MAGPSILEPLLGRLAAAPSRTGSLIVTIFGDAVVPRGGSVWLGTLGEILRAMGIGDGVVRTAVSRLTADGWLEREKVGRNSFYRLADKGRATFAAATERIYGATPHPWTGAFRLAVIEAGGDRAQLRAALAEAGWGALSPTVAVVPETPGTDEMAALAEADRAQLLTLSATGELATMRRLAALAWPLGDVAERYGRVVGGLRPIAAALDGGAAFSDLDALIARILLVHEYRRAILKDPLLPADLLPEDWPAAEARALCAAIYRRLVPPSERWLDARAIAEHGPLPPPDAAFRRRFAEAG